MVMLFSCSQPAVETKVNVPNDSLVVRDSMPEFYGGVWRPESDTLTDTLKINYAEHKDLLEILQVLPDSALVAWSWNKEGRAGFVKFISANNYILDTKRDLIWLTLLKPNTLKVQVVDGSWSLSIYKSGDGSYRVISDMRIGDSDYIHAYEYDKGKLSALKREQLLGDYFKGFLIEQDDKECERFVVDNEITFDYDFEDETHARITAAYLTEARLQNCLKGNVLDLQYNAQSKMFEISRVTWLKD